MSLDDILKSISDSADQEVAEIKKQGQEQLAKIKAEYETKLAKRKKQLLAQIQTEADRKVSQASFEVKSIVNNKILTKKREILSNIYKQALDRLSQLSESDTQKLLVKLIKELPQLPQGEIIPVQGQEEIVAKAAQAARSSYPVSNQTVEGKGGFIFVANGLTINNTYQEIIKNLKEQTETEITNILF